MLPVIPAYVAPIILTPLLGLAVWLALLVARAARDAGLPPRTRSRVTLAAALALGAWFLAALLRAPSLPQLDPAGRAVIPTAFAVFGGLSFAAVFGGLALSDAWRRTLAAIPVERLVAVQTFRLLGLVFVALWAIGTLPARFALPAGLGDVAVGLAAPLVALGLARRSARARAPALAWNTLGLLDLVAAIGLGTGVLLSLLEPGTPVRPAAAMTMFPLVLVPTFGVPLALILHLLTFRALARGRSARRGGRLPLSTHAAPAR